MRGRKESGDIYIAGRNVDSRRKIVCRWDEIYWRLGGADLLLAIREVDEVFTCR